MGRQAPKYPGTETTFDFGASFAKRLAFTIEHDRGFWVMSVYYDPASGRIDIHEAENLDARAARFGVTGFGPPAPGDAKRDFLVFLWAHAP